jgi:hypothetical protein
MRFVYGRKLIVTFFNRVLKEYFLYDFNIGFIYIIFGMPSLAFGIVYGTMELIYAASTNLPTPTGTLMIITLSIILGFQLILQAIKFEIINAPKCTF